MRVSKPRKDIFDRDFDAFVRNIVASILLELKESCVCCHTVVSCHLMVKEASGRLG